MSFSSESILSVSQVTQAIKLCLESSFSLLWLQGEVSNCKLHSSGHLYFSLKDSGAQIAAVMYRADAVKLRAVPKEGTQVIVRGELNVYPPSGKYQLIIKEMRPVGLGEMLLKLEELKIKLKAKGYFSKQRKRSIPKFPKRIGIVTSPTGAAIQDILTILGRRFSSAHILLNPVKVQGEGAAHEIAQAIEQFNAYSLADVLIVGRGGGSLEDLWPFNEEIVADAIFHSRIPIISAVGHETDHCVADYVADMRAPTPSAAAELVAAETAHSLHLLNQQRVRLRQTLRHLLRHQSQTLQRFVHHPLFQSPYALLGPWIQKLDDLREQIENRIELKLQTLRQELRSYQRQCQALKPTQQIVHMRRRLEHLSQLLQKALLERWQYTKRLFHEELRRRQLKERQERLLLAKRERLKKISAALHSVDPKNLLTKGYAILLAENGGTAVTSVHAVTEGERVKALLADGVLMTKIEKVSATL